MKKFRTVLSKIAVFLATIVIMIVLHYVKVMQPLETAITFFLKPAQVQLYRIGLLITNYELLKEKNILITENEDLIKKNNELLGQNSALLNLLSESKILENQKNFLEEKSYRYEPAKIISKYNDENAQIITINQGKNKKLEDGFAVIAENGVMVGKIFTVSANTADVLLITSNATKIAAQIQNNSNTPGIVIGQHGLSLAMELIPKEDKIETHNLVITSGAENKIPKGLVIGEIESVIDNLGDLFSQAKIIPLIDYNNLSIVSVIIP